MENGKNLESLAGQPQASECQHEKNNESGSSSPPGLRARMSTDERLGSPFLRRHERHVIECMLETCHIAHDPSGSRGRELSDSADPPRKAN